MNWKKFLEKKGDIYRADNAKCISIDNLKEFFLGEVARIEKEMKKMEEEFDWSDVMREYYALEGQLLVFKELAGVEE